MKRKYSILSMLFGLAILFAITLQSMHSYEHIQKALSEKQCHHKYAKNKTEIGHSHHDSDHCFVCEFTFSTSIKSDFYNFNFKKVEVSVLYSFFYSKEITQSFRGSLFALRAPPIFIV
jgi:hypothetical protein